MTADLLAITGLSMAARAHRVTDREEAGKVIRMMPLKYPDAPPQAANIEMPSSTSRRRPNWNDTDSLPPYEVARPDPEAAHRRPASADWELAEASAFAARLRDSPGGVALAERIRRMVARNEYKRRQAPPSILPFFDGLRAAWQEVAEEHAKWASSPYPPVFVTADAVVRMADHVL